MNWGNKLLATFIVFAGGMSFLVYKCLHTNYEMVESDYYKKELHYQQVIDGAKEANNLATQVTIQQTGKNIVLQLPEEMKNKPVSGEVWFYCAYDQKKDKKIPLKAGQDGSQTITSSSVQPGNYTVKISWKDEQKNYYAEKPITVL
ncbi:MAG: FixH family protein [Chitinophagaceae bacterium]